MKRNLNIMGQADFSRSLELEVCMMEFQQDLKVKGARIASNMLQMKKSLTRKRSGRSNLHHL